MASNSSSRTTLTQVTYFTRLLIIYGLIAIIVLLLAKIGYDAFTGYLARLRCQSPDPTNRIYNDLPPLTFPRQSTIQKPTSYVLRLEGEPLAKNSDQTLVPPTPPKLLTQVIYPTSAGTTTLAADSRVREIATAFGFAGDPTQITGEEYRWSQGGATLQINKRTLTINFNSNFLTNNEYLNRTGKTLPTSSQATQLVKENLSALRLLPDDVASQSAQVTHLKALGNELVEVNSISEADFVQVALQREAVEQETTDDRCQPLTRTIPFVQPADTASSIVAIIARDFLDQDHIVQLDYHYRAIDFDFPAVYSARTLEQAWTNVQAGDAYIASPINSKQAVITGYYIGYFESIDEQPYLQPVYVFTGEDDFVAYVPAISSIEVDSNWFLNQTEGRFSNLSLTNTATQSATFSSTASSSATTASPTPRPQGNRPSPTPTSNILNPTASTRSANQR